jgi:hypothetical protein
MSASYKFGFVLTDSKDYLNKDELDRLDFINENHKTDLKLRYDSKGIVYIEEDVNMPNSDKFMLLLKNNNVDIREYVSVVKWKDFPKVN